MISTLFKSFKLTIAFSLLFSICYIFVLWIFAQVAGPNKGNAEVLELNGKVVGAANVGQNFTEDIYFWGRPSCAGDGYRRFLFRRKQQRPFQRRIPFGNQGAHRHLPRSSSLSDT